MVVRGLTRLQLDLSTAILTGTSDKYRLKPTGRRLETANFDQAEPKLAKSAALTFGRNQPITVAAEMIFLSVATVLALCDAC